MTPKQQENLNKNIDIIIQKIEKLSLDITTLENKQIVDLSNIIHEQLGGDLDYYQNYIQNNHQKHTNFNELIQTIFQIIEKSQELEAKLKENHINNIPKQKLINICEKFHQTLNIHQLYLYTLNSIQSTPIKEQKDYQKDFDISLYSDSKISENSSINSQDIQQINEIEYQNSQKILKKSIIKVSLMPNFKKIEEQKKEQLQKQIKNSLKVFRFPPRLQLKFIKKEEKK